MYRKGKFYLIKQFLVSVAAGFIEEESSREIHIEFLAWDIAPDEPMPKVQHFQGELSIMFHIAKIPVLKIPMHGYLVDVHPSNFRLQGTLKCRRLLTLVMSSQLVQQNMSSSYATQLEEMFT
jgi:hypothetical protein